jgi:diaminopimelate decarboxylase
MAITKENGHLYIAGMDAKKIAQTYGTPVYVYDRQIIEETMQEFADSFVSKKFQGKPAYASKAFSCKAMLQLAKQFGLGADVVSLGELETAKRAGMDMGEVVFHGNNKSACELQKALEYQTGLIVIDSLQEAMLLDALAQAAQRKQDVLVRINPGIDAHTHKYIQTANLDSKFGISIADETSLQELAKILKNSGALNFKGFHAHIGSQIFEPESFVKETGVVCEFAKAFEDTYQMPVTVLDLGGGFGVRYTDADKPAKVKDVCTLLVKALEEQIDQLDLHLEKVIIEPGRAIAAPAGLTLYTVGFSKMAGEKQYVFVDGGMSDNIRPALYQAAYDADIATNMDAPKSEEVCIAGKCCESGDVLIEKTMLQPSHLGDILAVYTTGAYGYSMASNYNKLAFPGALFVKDGKASWAIRPQSLEQLLEREEDLDADTL